MHKDYEAATQFLELVVANIRSAMEFLPETCEDGEKLISCFQKFNTPGEINANMSGNSAFNYGAMTATINDDDAKKAYETYSAHLLAEREARKHEIEKRTENLPKQEEEKARKKKEKRQRQKEKKKGNQIDADAAIEITKMHKEFKQMLTEIPAIVATNCDAIEAKMLEKINAVSDELRDFKKTVLSEMHDMLAQLQQAQTLQDNSFYHLLGDKGQT